MRKWPSKIGNLFWLKKMGFEVPAFFVVDKDVIKNIDSKTKEMIDFFLTNGVHNVIIRSASYCEDSDEKSQAGFFKSSEKVPLKNLIAKKILELWTINKTKSREIGCADICIFIQEYIDSTFSGVLFTQQVYDGSEAKLILSSASYAVTDGKEAGKSITYEREKDRWIDQNLLSESLRKKLSKII